MKLIILSSVHTKINLQCNFVICNKFAAIHRTEQEKEWMWKVGVQECSVALVRLSTKQIQAKKAAIGARKNHHDVLVAQIHDDHRYAKEIRPIYRNNHLHPEQSSKYVAGSGESQCANCDTSDDTDLSTELITDMKY